MKTTVIFIWVLSLLMITSCSKDDIDEPVSESPIEFLDQQRQPEAKKFKFKESGKFEYVAPRSCSTSYEINFHGSMESEFYGSFETTYHVCTNFDGKDWVKGMHIDMDGDQLFFFSEDMTQMADGSIHYLFNYYGGTGKWRNATGMVRLINRKTEMASKIGYYENYAEGTLSY